VRLAVVVLCVVGMLIGKETRESNLFNENLLYRLVYNGISGADAELNIGAVVDNTLTLHWSVATGPIFSFLFPVDNEYITLLDHNQNILVASRKSIDQRNVKGDLAITYDFQKKLAVTDNGECWQIPQETTNIMGMLYDVRSRQLEPGDSLHYTIDIETQLWHLGGTVSCDSMFEHEQITQPARLIHFTFAPVDTILPRPWKTDLFTNNISGEGAELKIVMGPHPQNIPLFIQFLNGKKRVEMYLKE